MMVQLIETRIPLETFCERAWYAYHCLPRVDGRLPSQASLLGKRRQLVISRLFRGCCVDPRQETRALIAEALRVTRTWLDHGDGEPPELTGSYRPMGGTPEVSVVADAEQAHQEAPSPSATGASLVVFRGTPIGMRSSYGEEELCLTDMWRANGADPNRRPAEWARQAETKRFLAAFTAMGIAHTGFCAESGGGAGGGETWAHWQVGFKYAAYLAPEFAIRIHEAAREQFERGRSPESFDAAAALARAFMEKTERRLQALEALREATQS